jgi:anti-sigma B factor antagonist
MAPPLTLNTDRGADGTPRVVVAGEIDLSNTAEFTRALIRARAGSRVPLTVDLSAVKYIDSAGINVLFDHAEEVDRLHVIVHPLLFRVLTISGLSKIAIVESAEPPPGGDGARS